MASNIPNDIDWIKMRKKTVKHWKTLLSGLLEAARRSLADGDSKAAATATSDLEELLEETRGYHRYQQVSETAEEILLDIARAKGLHSARKLASLTASILVRVKPLTSRAKTLSKTAARLEMRRLIKDLDLAEDVLERMKSMKEAGAGDDLNLDLFLGELEGVIVDLKSN